MDNLKTLCPSACGLRLKYIYPDEVQSPPPLTVETPVEKIRRFNAQHVCCNENCTCANLFIYYYLCYTDIQQEEIEKCTRGQSTNKHWHDMRKGLLTASNFHQICCSTDSVKTATLLLKGASLNDNCLPAAILFGRRYESKARELFLKGHRFRHRHCSVDVPGLVISGQTPFLACSPDGIVECKMCGRFLIEVKCFFKYKCFYPNNALSLSNICSKDENGKLHLKRSHKYYDQIQGQMAITGIRKSVLVCYTHKGIATVDVEFDEEFWKLSLNKMSQFYKDVYFPIFKTF